MHYSAKLGIGIACRPSVRRLFVCLSVCKLVDQDHTGWKSWKLIARTISPAPSLFVAHLLPEEHGEFWGDWRWCEKSGVLEHKSGNISETRRDRGKVTMEALYELTNALSNGTIPDPLRPPLHQDWGSPPQPKTSIAIISGKGKATDFKFGRYIHSVHPKKPIKIWRKGSVGVSRDCPNFWNTPYNLRNGKATNFKFCTHIHRIDRNKSPYISGKVAMGVLRDSRKFSGHHI